MTLGARALASLRSFYGRRGWTETGAPVPAAGWNGVTFAINVSAEDELRSVFDAAVAAGATVVAPITRREWGGTSGYVADPEGNRWELAVGSGSD